jgi:GNAT superfamily N-acetyltransferase
MSNDYINKYFIMDLELMNSDIITNNLFDLWSHIGRVNGMYTEHAQFKTVSVIGSDWPNRIYAVADTIERFDEIIGLSNQQVLPNIITLHNHAGIAKNEKMQPRFTQVNMALDVNLFTDEIALNPNINPIETLSEAKEFARIATEAFGYRVDGEIVCALSRDSAVAKLFLYREMNMHFGCGIVFFDQNNHAGFHMIGTIPAGRGKGIGKMMTERLIEEARIHTSNYCVLNASKMGESIYSKLGFTTFGTLENYTIVK